jgi:hypothetical protein
LNDGNLSPGVEKRQRTQRQRGAGEDVLVMRWKRFPYVDQFGEKTAAISPG